MRTVIMHFYNEEYMLPWWLTHHRAMFDHGILIDYASTDRSVEICRELAPDWNVVRSRNVDFAALDVDLEVMIYEYGLPGFKIALTVTEFLCSPQLSEVEAKIVEGDLDGWMIEGVTMVDTNPEVVPSPKNGLVSQKHCGFLERDSDFKDKFSPHTRLYHRAKFGAYTPGRHHTHLPRVGHGDTNANVLWYVFCPWQPEFIQRKLQIRGRIPDRDRKAGFGFQHMYEEQQLEGLRQSLLSQTIDLAGLPSLRPPSA
jgi:hypothetical protein